MEHMFTSSGKQFQNLNILLVSESQSRIKIMTHYFTPNFKTMKSGFAEDLDQKSYKNYREYCIATCRGKKDSFLKKVEHSKIDFDIAILCDSIIGDQFGKIFEKPEDKEDHKAMLKHFMGINVFNACALIVLYDTVKIRNKLQGKPVEEKGFDRKGWL